MTIPQDVKSAFIKIFQVIGDNPEKLTGIHPEYFGRHDECAYTVRNIESIACNHLFDDNFRAYGLTEFEGSAIRYYFSMGSETYDFIKDLRTEFPDFFKHPESQEYLDSANDRRKSRNLSLISL